MASSDWSLESSFGGIQISLYHPNDVKQAPLEPTGTTSSATGDTEDAPTVDDSVGESILELPHWDVGPFKTNLPLRSEHSSSITASILSHTVEADIPSPTYSTPSSGAGSLSGDSIFDQLLSAVSPTFLSGSVSTFSSSLSDEIQTDSLDESSPCPVRNQLRTIPLLKPRSPQLRHVQSRKSPTRPSFSTTKYILSPTTKVRKRKERKVSIDPFKIRKNPWTKSEKTLLCVLYRWYEGANQSDIPHIFKALLGSDRKTYNIRTYFKNNVCFYGPACFPELRHVFFDVPFDDPAREYANLRGIIEAKAIAMGIGLSRRLRDVGYKFGTASKAKSQYTRQRNKARRWAVIQKSTLPHLPSQTKNSVSFESWKSRRGRAVAFEVGTVIDAIEQDDDLLPVTTIKDSSIVEDERSLGFRVWDPNSWTQYTSDRGFVAQVFSCRGSAEALPKPIAMDDSYGAFMVLADAHLSKKDREVRKTSAFVSVTTSLLQALTYASTMAEPYLALIDLSHASLNVPNKRHHAKNVLRWLKSNDRAPWRYRGSTEWLIWASVPPQAILNVIPLSLLREEADKDREFASLMNLEVFKPDSGADPQTGTVSSTRRSVPAIGKSLCRKNIILNCCIARALGSEAQLFGLSNTNTEPRHISDFVARKVDGWSITAPTKDIHTMSDMARIFALNLKHQTLHLQAVMDAFMTGCEHGTREIKRYERRKS